MQEHWATRPEKQEDVKELTKHEIATLIRKGAKVYCSRCEEELEVNRGIWIGPFMRNSGITLCKCIPAEAQSDSSLCGALRIVQDRILFDLIKPDVMDGVKHVLRGIN